MPSENFHEQISILAEEILSAARIHSISLDINQLEQLRVHGRLLMKWNRGMNLSRIRDPKAIAGRHFLEGLFAGEVLRRMKENGPLLDLGSGNGFPGVPMAVACPEALPLTLVESSEKKAAFLRALLRELGWNGSQVVVRRIDKGSDLEDLPCRIFTSRGVALSFLEEEGFGFLQPGSLAILFLPKPSEHESIHGFRLEEYRPIPGRETGILVLRKT